MAWTCLPSHKVWVDSAAMDSKDMITLIDAKHQANGLIARGDQVPMTVVTDNQLIGYPMIRNGQAGQVIARGAAASSLRIAGQDVSSLLNPKIEIHTNDISGNIVRMDLDGNYLSHQQKKIDGKKGSLRQIF